MTNIRGAVDQPSGVFRRLLVGFDGSSESRRALRIARSLAADVGGEVHVLSVVSSRPHAGTSQARLAALDEERMRLFDALSSEQPLDGRDGAPFSHVVYFNNAAEGISAFATEHGFDLVVVGTHGSDQVMHRGVGKTVEMLLRSHPCPVLVV